MNYSCNRCGSIDFRIDIIEDNEADPPFQIHYDVMCGNCQLIQGTMEADE
jgi:hypothetical protein